jgi:hypothetical protein
MADEQKGSAGLSIETKIATEPTTSITMGEPGLEKPKASTDKGEASSVQFGDDGVTTKTGLGEDDESDLEADLEDGGDEENEGEGDEGGDASDEEPLGEFKADDPESVAAYEATYFAEDGKLNTDKLSQEFWANAAKGEEGGLNDGTYAYLEHRLGITKDAVKDIEAALVAKSEAATNALYERVGSKDDIAAAIAWGKGGGYNDEQRKRFNEAMNSKDPQVQEEALEVLMARFGKSGAKTQAPKPTERPAKPTRTVTGASGAAGAEGYASEADYRKAFRDARAIKDTAKRNAAIAENRTRLRRSAWYGKG